MLCTATIELASSFRRIGDKHTFTLNLPPIQVLIRNIDRCYSVVIRSIGDQLLILSPSSHDG